MLVWQNKKKMRKTSRGGLFQEQQAEIVITLLKAAWCIANKVQNTVK